MTICDHGTSREEFSLQAAVGAVNLPVDRKYLCYTPLVLLILLY